MERLYSPTDFDQLLDEIDTLRKTVSVEFKRNKLLRSKLAELNQVHAETRRNLRAANAEIEDQRITIRRLRYELAGDDVPPEAE